MRKTDAYIHYGINQKSSIYEHEGALFISLESHRKIINGIGGEPDIRMMIERPLRYDEVLNAVRSKDG